MTPHVFHRTIFLCCIVALLAYPYGTTATPLRPSLLVTGRIVGTPELSWIIPGNLTLLGHVTALGKTIFPSDTTQHIIATFPTLSNLGHVYQQNNDGIIIGDSCCARTWHHEGQGMVDLVRFRGHLIMTDSLPVFFGMNEHAYLMSDSGYGTCTLAPEQSSNSSSYFFPMGNYRMGYTPLWIDDTTHQTYQKPPRIDMCLRRDTLVSLDPSYYATSCSVTSSHTLVFTCKQPFLWDIHTDTTFHYQARSYLPSSCGALPHRILSFPWDHGVLYEPCTLTEWTHQDSTRGGTYQGSRLLGPASGISSLLPITALELRSHSGNRMIHLSWKIVGMDHYDHYIVTRSRDGIHFTPLGTEYNLSAFSLSYDDTQIDPGIEYYYQIQGILPDETVITSNIVSGIYDEVSASLSLSPQPCDSYTQIHTQEQVLYVEIYDVLGNPVARFSDPQGISLIDTQETPAGYYLVHLKTSHQEITCPLIVIHNP